MNYAGRKPHTTVRNTNGVIMQCERCNNNEATVHLTEIIKGVKSEVHLCEGCAKDIGLNSKLSNFSLAVPDFLSFLNDEVHDASRGTDGHESVCKKCGTQLKTVRKERRVGCALCYSYFREPLRELMGGKQLQHTGKVPENRIDVSTYAIQHAGTSQPEQDVTILRTRLNEAVSNEEYEQAAVLRDRIRELEQICQE